ncbi:GNAT family N-acetyltransferase [Arthrobacter sp. M4]|uniref:GNAT family N-acetyltransferase n=1 Tax=Arthrobacter sp. M4 TaxID=218160 RepID=UPI001CDBFFBF|nr:GNAT family N-acetyltransferase [Arthrobacter sp. M4]MCA4135482.1 GNAT family N-acetyltransferase [Arthrobacter sp. M4]
MMQLLAQGWGPEKVMDRYLRYARELVDAGVTFRAMKPADKPEAWSLISRHVTMPSEWKIAKHEGGILAHDPGGKLIGALLMNGMSFDGPQGPQLMASIRSVVVDPGWRGRGVGVVTLGMADRPFHPQRPSFYLGNCAEADARFYQRLGYTVLQPGAEFPLPLGAETIKVNITNPDYPCFFFQEQDH